MPFDPKEFLGQKSFNPEEFLGVTQNAALEPQERKIAILPPATPPTQTVKPSDLVDILKGGPLQTQKKIVSTGDPYNIPDHIPGAELFRAEATKVEVKPVTNIPIPVVEASAPKTPVVKSSAKLLEYTQASASKNPSASAITDQQLRAREVLDEFGGDKNALRGKVGQLGKSLNMKPREIDELFFDIMNKANAIAPGTKVSAGSFDIKTSGVPLSAPVSGAPSSIPKPVTTKITVSPKSVLEGIEQAVVRAGGGTLDVNEGRRIASKAGQISGDIAQLSMSIGSTVGLGKTLAKSSSRIVRKIGGILANPNINPIPDAAYAANAEGNFGEEFFKGYAINLVASGIMEGKVGFKPFEDMSGEDRKILKDFLKQYQDGVESGKIPRQFSMKINPKVAKELGLDKIKLEPPSEVIPAPEVSKAITVVNPPVKRGYTRIPEDPTSWAKAFPIRDEIRGLGKSMQSRINARNKKLFATVDKLRLAMKRSSNVDPKQIDALLESPELRAKFRAGGGMSDDLLDAVDDVRNLIDDLATQLEVDGNILSEALEITVDANKGIYMKRSFKKWNDKDWWKKVSKDKAVMDDAREFVKDAYGDRIMKTLKKQMQGAELNKRKIALRKSLGRTLTKKEISGLKDEVKALGTPVIDKEMFDRAVDGELELIATAQSWTADGMSNFKAWLGSVNRNNLKKRKDIPLPIRKLMGEIEDPITNAIFTAQGIATQLEQTRFNREIMEKFMMGGDSPVIFEQATKGYTTPITMDMGLGVKKTLYTSTEFAKEFKTIKTEFSMVTKMAMKANGFFKAMQTVYNPKSHLRNLYGNSLIAVFNGHIYVQKMPEALKMLLDPTFKPELMEELTKRGLLGSNVVTGQLAEMTRKSFGLFNKDVDKMTLKQLSKQQTDLPSDLAQKLYQMEDDVWKIYGYLNEIEKGYPHLDAIANAIAEYPNYANLPRWHNWLMEQGWSANIGTFTAFPTSMVISTGNSVKLAAQEMAGKTALGKKSYTRAMAIAASAGVYAGRHKIVEMYNKHVGDGETFSDKFDMSNYEVAEIIKGNSSPWLVNADVMPTRIVDIETPSGKSMIGIEYYNNSYLNPYSVVLDPIEALAKGDIGGAALALMQPYTDPSMLTSFGIMMFTGKDQNGKEIRSVQDPLVIQLSNTVVAAMKSVSPWAIGPDPEKIRADIVNDQFKWEEFLPVVGLGDALSTGDWGDVHAGKYSVKGYGYEAAKWDKAANGYIDEYGNKYTYQQEFINFATGSRKQIFIPEQQMKNNLWSTKGMYQISMRTATKKMRNEDDASIIEMYVKDGEKFRRDAWDQMRTQIATFKKFGLTDKDVIAALKEIGVTGQMGVSLMSGVYVPYKPKDAQIKAIRTSRQKKGLNEYTFEF